MNETQLKLIERTIGAAIVALAAVLFVTPVMLMFASGLAVAF